jgi:hypothetical protein
MMVHSASTTGTGMGGSGAGAGFPRTRTNSSGQGDGKWRRKVGFEAFEAGPAALFAYTCAVSLMVASEGNTETDEGVFFCRRRVRGLRGLGIRGCLWSLFQRMNRGRTRWIG